MSWPSETSSRKSLVSVLDDEDLPLESLSPTPSGASVGGLREVLYTFGSGRQGVLGHGRPFVSKQLLPRRVKGFNAFDPTSLCFGWSSAFVLTRESRRVFSWGAREVGDVGPTGLGHSDESLLSSGVFQSEVAIPRSISSLETEQIIQVSCHDYTSFFLTVSRTVFCCGTNTHGQLGEGPVKERVEEPRRLHFPEPVARMAAGEHHFGVLTRTGVVFMLGSHSRGQLGLGTLPGGRLLKISSPRAVPLFQRAEKCADLSFGNQRSVFLSRAGSVWVCGSGLFPLSLVFVDFTFQGNMVNWVTDAVASTSRLVLPSELSTLH